MSFESREPTNDSLNHNQRPPFFFREQYANLIVKGNFMTLAAKPVLVEEGEWLAHQSKTDLPTERRHTTDTTPYSRRTEPPTRRYAQDHPRSRP